MGTERRRQRLESVLKRRQPDLTVVMENIHDPHNVSAMLRSCDAAGVMQVQLVYTREQFPTMGKKSSASAAQWVEQRMFRSVEECCGKLKDEGFVIAATRIGKSSRSLYDVDLTQKVALVFGNEHRGVSEECAAMADVHVMIPMAGMIQSLNVSVACAVALYEAVRQRLLHGHYDRQKLSSEEFTAMLRRWEQRR